MNETRTLANWVAGLRHEPIPASVREHAKRFILDNLGCQIAGATLPWSQSYYDVIRRTRRGSHSTVTYFGDKLSPDDAAFINSAFNHANDTDDTHLKSPTHPGSVAMPASLAMAEYTTASGEDLLVAVIAAYEIHIRISWACSPFLHYRGHHPPVACGPFGAAAASAILMGLDPEQTLNALSISGSHSAGLMEYANNGGSVKRIHSGIAAQAGVRAALFSEAGITGPHSILEGEKGFCKVFAGEYDLNRLTHGLGTRYELMDNGLKPHSCCHVIHATLDTLDKIRETQPLKPDEIKSIKVYMNSDRLQALVGTIVEPEDVLGAQFSLPFSVAMRLHHGGRGVNGGNGFWDYPHIDLKDSNLRETARKVKCLVATNNEWACVDKCAGVAIETKDGRLIEDVVPFSKGLPENPMSAEEVKEKFHALVDPILPPGRPREIVDAIDNIERMESIEELVRLLIVPPTGRLKAKAGGQTAEAYANIEEERL